jgi:hypothetical protein
MNVTADSVNLTIEATPGMVITIEPGVTVSSANDLPALTILGAASLVNRGRVIGSAGKGGSVIAVRQFPRYQMIDATDGGPALSINAPVSIDNREGIIAGGGGGGGAAGYEEDMKQFQLFTANGGNGAGVEAATAGGAEGAAGGLAGAPGKAGTPGYGYLAGGGGGGWGANGGDGTSMVSAITGQGGRGGEAVITNGGSITWIGGAESTSRVYGVVR